MLENMIKKFLNNKHLIAIMIICLIAMTCISFASAADVNENPVNNTDLDDSIVVNFNNETVTNDVINNQTVNDTQPVVDNIDWKNYDINPENFNNPTVLHINTVDDLHNAASQVYLAKQNNIDLIVLVFDNDNVYYITPWFKQNLLNPTCKMLIIEGNGATIKINNPKDSNEYHFLNNDVQTIVSGLTLKGFNTAIVNNCNLLVKDCTFDGNRLEYYFKEDYGGAIKNYGNAFIFNSTFKNNYAKFGGAIWSSAESTLYICNSTFVDNRAYNEGDDIVYKEGCNFKIENCAVYNIEEFDLATTIKAQSISVIYACIGGGIIGAFVGDIAFDICLVVSVIGFSVTGVCVLVLFGLMVVYMCLD